MNMFELSEAINDDFIQKLTILDLLFKTNVKTYNLKKIENKDEISFRSFNLNPFCKFAGRYYKKENSCFTIWLGYYSEYGFCICFWSTNQTDIDNLIDKLRNNKIDYNCKYSQALNKTTEEKYWCIVKLTKLNNKDELHTEVRNILDIIFP